MTFESVMDEVWQATCDHRIAARPGSKSAMRALLALAALPPKRNEQPLRDQMREAALAFVKGVDFESEARAILQEAFAE